MRNEGISTQIGQAKVGGVGTVDNPRQTKVCIAQVKCASGLLDVSKLPDVVLERGWVDLVARDSAARQDRDDRVPNNAQTDVAELQYPPNMCVLMYFISGCSVPSYVVRTGQAGA